MRRAAIRGDPAERRLERGQPVRAQPARSGMEVDRVDREPVPGGGRERLGEPVLVDPELRRPLAAVREAGVVAGAGGRVDPETDRPPGSAPTEALDLADRVEVDVDRRGQEDVEVPLRDVRAGEADLLGRPAALEGAGHLAGRAGIDADDGREAPRGPAGPGAP